MQHPFHAVNYVLVLAPPLLHVTWSVSIVSWRAKGLTSSFLAGAFWHFTFFASASLTFITSKSFKLDFIGADVKFNPRETGQQKHPANWANSNLSASKPDTIAESGGFPACKAESHASSEDQMPFSRATKGTVSDSLLLLCFTFFSLANSNLDMCTLHFCWKTSIQMFWGASEGGRTQIWKPHLTAKNSETFTLFKSKRVVGRYQTLKHHTLSVGVVSSFRAAEAPIVKAFCWQLPGVLVIDQVSQVSQVSQAHQLIPSSYVRNFIIFNEFWPDRPAQAIIGSGSVKATSTYSPHPVGYPTR